MGMGELSAACRTIRKFKQDPIPDEVLAACANNARLSSSASNSQPIRYVVVKDPAMVAKMQPLVKWAGKLPPELGVPGPDQRPTAFIALPKAGGVPAFSDIDLGIAAHAIVLTAWEAGVGSCMMGAIDREAIKSLLQIPADWELKLVIALGYPGVESTVEEAHDGNIAYYLDENRNYHVPKLPLDEVACFL